MDLRGARLAIARESAKRRNLDEETIKRLTGGDTLKARRMHRDFEEFAPTHKLVLMTNHKPRTSMDTALWRRLRLIPFNHAVTGDAIDPELGGKLRLEASGILNWMLAGCLRWQKQGLNPPKSVIDLTAEHHADQDLLGQFFKECVVFDGSFRCTMSELYDSYLFWCADNGIKTMGKIGFGKATRERYPDVSRFISSGSTKLRGIKPTLIIR